MSALEQKADLLHYWNSQCALKLQERNNLSRDDLEYLVDKSASMRDERLKSCIAGLIGWGDEERAEFETFCAIALEIMQMMRPSQLREAARRVELRAYLKEKIPND